MKGRIFSIEEFSIFDGPGIRTTVFLKGCPLKCSWCHNPEGQSYDKEYAKLSGGVKVYGEDITSEALAEKLLKNAVILNGSGGGVTFSGGEPLFQADFYIDCAKKLSGKLSCALQTTGYATSEVFNKTLLFTDFYLYDLKLFDLKKHEEFCGVKNDLIIKNYKTLAGSGKNFVTRIPLIPSVTDTEENLSSLAKFISSCDVRCVELLPYNKFAGAKYANLSREYKPAFDETKKVNINKEIFSDYKITAKVF